MVNIPNFYDRCVALLASQFQIRLPDGGRTNFQKMLFAISTMSQLINDQETLLQTMRYLNTAQGVQLDGIGQIVGLPRNPNETDANYRERLQFQIFVNGSSGTPEQVMRILAFLTRANKIWFFEAYPASYTMATDGLVFPNPPSDLVTAIQSASPAGVEFSAVIATYGTVPFVFSGDPFISPFFVAPNPNDILELHQFQADPGTGPEDFFVNSGQTDNPDFGGGFAEALGFYPNYTYDNTGAGQLTEAIMAI